MTRIIVVFFAVLILVSCKQKVEIERFVWIQHNLNWIHKPSDLKARNYIEYNNRSGDIFYARNNFRLKQTEYYSCEASDTLINMILESLQGKTFPEIFEEKEKGMHIYDGDYYCIIYKFKNEPERIINYLPYTIPDSLKRFTSYIENLTTLKNYKVTNAFDIHTLIDKHRQVIIGRNQFVPPPIKTTIKFTPAPIDTMIE